MSESRRDHDLIQHRRYQQLRLLKWLLVVPLMVAVIAGTVVLIDGVNLVITPEGAARSARIVRTQGVGFVLGSTVYRLGPIEAEVSAEGFRSQRVAISADNATGYLALELQELPSSIRVVATPPSEALEWRVAAEVLGTGSVLEAELESGVYTLVADAAYYELATLELLLKPAQYYEFTLALEPVQGLAHIATLPPGAQVTLNGEAVGQANLKLDLPGGAYLLEVSMPGHVTVTDQIEITREQRTVRRTFQLRAQPALLSINVVPPGGTLLLDGRVVQPGAEHKVSPNAKHVISYDAAGFHPEVREVRLNSGETRALSMALASHEGRVIVESEPSGLVAVNDRVVGVTPVTLTLPAIEQVVRISKPGYASHTQTIHPTDARDVLIKAALLTEQEHQRRTALPQYRNAAGITLVLFQPDSYDKGAPRGEPYQRANELLHKVRLQRPFYASMHEVSVGQFHAVSGSGASTEPPDLPKTGVSWLEAVRYCNWLSKQEQLQPVYRFDGDRYLGAETSYNGYRLLTESEWEWLIRKAGRKHQTIFEWGDERVVPPGAGNFADEQARQVIAPEPYIGRYDDGFARLAPIGSFAAGPSGLFDLSGNAGEWTHDVYTLRPATEPDGIVDPTGPAQGSGHVIKGASWRSGSPEQLRGAYRDVLHERRDDIGFRVARYLYNVQ